MSYYPTYEVVIAEEVPKQTNKTLFSISIGSKAVEELYELAEAGIPEAKRVDLQWGYNVDIYFDAAGFAEFTKHHYCRFHNYFVQRIGDGKTYLLCGVDFS